MTKAADFRCDWLLADSSEGAERKLQSRAVLEFVLVCRVFCSSIAMRSILRWMVISPRTTAAL
jgi:hypothetical protein